MPRKKKKYHFIYKTTNLITGRYYIGMHSSDDLEDGYLGSGKRLRRSIKKYGKENHKREILEFVDSREELKNREKEIVDLNEIAKKECMNLKPGGEGGLISEEHLIKMREGASRWMKERWEDEEFRKLQSKLSSEKMKEHHKNGKINYNTFEGKNHTEETKIKMSLAKKGKGEGENNSQFGTCWIFKGKINKRIKKEELENYIDKGWKRGRKI